MRIWFALLVAPVLALTDQGISYAAAGWTCARQNMMVGHLVHALFLATVVTAALLAWRLRRETAAAADERMASRHFLAGVGIASSALAGLIIATMWIANGLISPCAS